LTESAEMLEKARRDMQDIEFTIENGRFFLLQTRKGKRTPNAALKIAVDLVAEGLIDRAEALRRVAAIDPAKVGETSFVEDSTALAHAVAAAPGVACGRACFTSVQAEEITRRGEKAILIRRDTSTEDLVGFAAAEGILTAIGGRTSHAAVVARQMGKVCLVGCAALAIEADERGATIGGQTLRQGDWIALDGKSGAITLGRREIAFELTPQSKTIIEWRKEIAAKSPANGNDENEGVNA
jgi:pyruvate,orthophosphate dikinase